MFAYIYTIIEIGGIDHAFISEHFSPMVPFCLLCLLLEGGGAIYATTTCHCFPLSKEY